MKKKLSIWRNSVFFVAQVSDFKSVKVGYSHILPLVSVTFYLFWFILFYIVLYISMFNNMA